MKYLIKQAISIIVTTILFYCGSINADPRITILNFELNDITSLPNNKEEQKRTGSIKLLLEQTMKTLNNYDVIQIPIDMQKKSNPGLGYLFRYHDITAKLGKQFGADWIIVGQHSKPSFLFSYLVVYLINVDTEKAVAKYAIELKGNHQKVTQRAVKRLAINLNNKI